MPDCYQITKWAERFENNRTRGMKNMAWVPLPNHHDGYSFAELMGHDQGTAIYGAWVLILQVASKCSERGVLVRDNGAPHDAGTLACVTRGDKTVFEIALKELVKVGWLTLLRDEVVIPQEGAGIRHPPAALKTEPICGPHPTDEEGKGREEKERCAAGALDCSSSTVLKKPHTATVTISPQPVELSLPVALQTIGFQAAWDKWHKHRGELRRPMKPTAKAELVQKCLAWGVVRATQAIEHSLCSGYQGIFEASQGAGKPVVARPSAAVALLSPAQIKARAVAAEQMPEYPEAGEVWRLFATCYFRHWRRWPDWGEACEAAAEEIYQVHDGNMASVSAAFVGGFKAGLSRIGEFVSRAGPVHD